MLQYQKQLGSFQPQFTLLHDMARHISHNKEILDVAADTLDSIIYEQSVLDEQHPRPADRVPWHVKDVHQQLYLTSKGIRATKLRCISLSERLQNEINLVSLSYRAPMGCTDLIRHSTSSPSATTKPQYRWPRARWWTIR